jgi:hypothetical protein
MGKHLSNRKDSLRRKDTHGGAEERTPFPRGYQRKKKGHRFLGLVLSLPTSRTIFSSVIFEQVISLLLASNSSFPKLIKRNKLDLI